MNYTEVKPFGIAAGIVRLYWQLSYEKEEMSGGPEPVLPDGCVEIIFDFRDRFLTYIGDEVTVEQPRSIVAGQMTSRLLIGPTGCTDMFGVRLRSEAAFSLLGISMAEIRDQIVDLSEIIGIVENELFEKLAAVGNFQSRIEIFEKYLATAILRPLSVELEACVSTLRRSNGSKAISRCAFDLGWSERRLERTFKEKIGLSPKVFAKIIRFQAFLAEAGSGNSSLLDSALYAGYHDQSHMIKDFHQFACVPPTQYFGRELMLTGLFVNS